MGDYLYALQRASNSSDMEWIKKNEYNYIAYGGPLSYPDGKSTQLGLIVSTYSQKEKTALYEAGKNNYQRSPQLPFDQIQNQYYMTGDINPIDIESVKRNVTTSGIVFYSDSPAFNLSVSYAFGPGPVGVGVSVGMTITYDAIFPVIGIGISSKGLGFSASYLGNSGVCVGGSFSGQLGFVTGQIGFPVVNGLATKGFSFYYNITLPGVEY